MAEVKGGYSQWGHGGTREEQSESLSSAERHGDGRSWDNPPEAPPSSVSEAAAAGSEAREVVVRKPRLSQCEQAAFAKARDLCDTMGVDTLTVEREGGSHVTHFNLTSFFTEAFKAGAAWQREQDDSA